MSTPRTSGDTCALLKLVIDEDGSERSGRLDTRQHRRARQELTALVEELSIVEITEELVADAADLAGVEGLSGCAAVHLAAAVTIEAAVLTSADTALCEAAHRRGLHVANPLSP